MRTTRCLQVKHNTNVGPSRIRANPPVVEQSFRWMAFIRLVGRRNTGVVEGTRKLLWRINGARSVMEVISSKTFEIDEIRLSLAGRLGNR